MANKDASIMYHTGQFLARRLRSFQLKSLICTSLGNDRFTEVYFKTKTDNVYRIYQPIDSKTRVPGNGFNIMNARTGLKTALTRNEIDQGVLKEGDIFQFGNGLKSTKITQIICINTNRLYGDDFCRNTPETMVRQEFRRVLLDY